MHRGTAGSATLACLRSARPLRLRDCPYLSCCGIMSPLLPRPDPDAGAGRSRVLSCPQDYARPGSQANLIGKEINLRESKTMDRHCDSNRISLCRSCGHRGRVGREQHPRRGPPRPRRSTHSHNITHTPTDFYPASHRHPHTNCRANTANIDTQSNIAT